MGEGAWTGPHSQTRKQEWAKAYGLDLNSVCLDGSARCERGSERERVRERERETVREWGGGRECEIYIYIEREGERESAREGERERVRGRE